MNSEEENEPPSETIAEGLRRSKRISGSDKNVFPSKVTKKNDEKKRKKSSTKAKSTAGNKSRRGRPPKTKESSFDGSYLTPEELQHLFIKFKRDGHFHVNPPKISPPPFVISRTTDGKSVVTKIECYEPERQYVRDLATSFTAQRTESEVLRETSDKTSLTFSTPLTENPAENLTSTSTDPGQFILPKDKPTNANAKQCFLQQNNNFGPNLRVNCVQTAQNSLPNPEAYSGAGNGFFGNSAGPNIHSKSSAAGNSQANGFGRTSGPTDFSYINSTRQTLPVQPNALFKVPPSSTCNPSNHFTQGSQNNVNTRGIRIPANAHNKNASGGDQANKTARRNAKEHPRANLQAQVLPNPYNCSNLNEARIRSPSHQQRQTNIQNSTFPLQNPIGPLQNTPFPLQKSTFPLQNSTFPLQKSTFPLQNSTFPLQNSTFPLQNSTFPLQNSTFPLQNSTFPLQNPNFPQQNSYNMSNDWNAANASAMANNAMILQPGNANSYASPQSMSSGYHSFSTSWNNDQWLPNSYIAATISPHNNYYNAPNAQGRCETATRPVIDNQSCVESQNNSWSQKNEPEKYISATSGNVTRNNSNVSTITSSDYKEPIEEAVFAVEGLADPQNSGLCPTVSSSSYDDDIAYNNYIGGDISYNNTDLEQVTQGNENSSRLPSIMSINPEMRPWYGGSNRYFGNNDQSNSAGHSDSNSFKTKEDVVDSSDCYIIEDHLKS